jgi:hypothetical protein
MQHAVTSVVSRTAKTAAAVVLGLCVLPTGGTSARGGDPLVVQWGDTLLILGDETADSVALIGGSNIDQEVGVFVTDVPWIYEGVENIYVDLQGGDNFLATDQLYVVGDLIILAGDGDDDVRLGGWGYNVTFIYGEVEIETGGGDDLVSIEDTWISWATTIDLGDGDNEFLTGHYLDTEVDGFQFHNLAITSGSGHDRLALLARYYRDVTITTGAGDDLVGLGASHATWATSGNHFEDLTVETGDGDDLVAMAGNELWGDAMIKAGNDDDLVLLGGLGGDSPNEFQEAFTAQGNSGHDVLWVDSGNVYAFKPHFQSFETISP